MKKLILKQQNPLILSIIGAMKTSILGRGIRHCHYIKIIRGHYDTQIEFSRKDGREINPLDFFMFGHLIGRDYDD